MAKKQFSSAVQDSLNGREQTAAISKPKKIDTAPAPTVKEEVVAVSVSAEKDVPIKKSTDKKKSNAGRKKIEDKKKKKQMVLTLTPDTYNRLIEWADTKARTAPNYVSEFVEEHINEIIK